MKSFYQRLVGKEVKVITGSYKGKTGRIKNIVRTAVYIEGVNVRMRHKKSSKLPKYQDGPAKPLAVEGPIHISNIKFINE